MRSLERVNKELWLLLSMFIIALLLNYLVDAQRMVLSFYTLPTLVSAYLYGRRHATLTAFAQRPDGRPPDRLQPSTLGRDAGERRRGSARWLDLTRLGQHARSSPAT